MAAVLEHMTLSEYICQKQNTTCTIVMGHSLTYMLPMQIAIQEDKAVQPAVAASATVVCHSNTIIPHDQRNIAVG